ncbi:Disease resistance protein [Nymphaea thermarum]|nr:Disease resistance protein [Nymphaea thermarum]
MDRNGDQERSWYDGQHAYGRAPYSSTKVASVAAFEFDVFLSFTCEEEEGESKLSLDGFICSLCDALEHHHLRAFIPNRQTEGKMEEVMGAMKSSKVFLPIFSKRYADSQPCLAQVAKMVEFKRLLLPVFYNVEPREVRNQRGSLETAFRKHQEDEELDQGRVESWKAALSEAGEIKGFDVMTDAETGKEQKLIPFIIKRILAYGTDNVKGIVLNSREGKQTCVAAEDFAAMSNLALLHINDAEICGDFRCLPKQIKWFEWENCPLRSLPAEFSPDEAVVIDLSESMISRLWNQERLETKTLGRLKVLNLGFCKKLIATPDFFSLPCLVKLLLDGCTSLVEVHQSIGCLKSLVTLSMSGCTSLKELPSSIYQLSSLKSLILQGCTRFSTFPELPDGTKLSENFSAKEVSNRQSKMLNPTFLDISSTCIREIPPSFNSFSKLKTLNLNYTSQITMIPPSFCHLKNLEKLGARQCKWSEHGNPSDYVVLPSVKKLDLWRCNFRSMPSWISSSFPNLRELALEECENLVSLPSFPSSLTKLNLIGCTNLETISDVSNLVNLKELFLNGCEKLVEVHGIQKLKSLRTLTTPPCCSTGSPLEKAVFEDEAFVCLKHFEGSGSLVLEGPAEGKLCFLLPKGPILQEAENLDFDFIMIDGHTEGSLIIFEVIGENQEVLFRTSLEADYEDAVDGICVVLFDRDDEILHYLQAVSNRIHVTFRNPEEVIGGTVSIGPFHDDEPLIFWASKSSRVLNHYYHSRFDGC